MKNIYHSLLAVIAGASQKELGRQIKYLKVENEILRSKLPKQITVTRKERQRLLKFGRPLGQAIRRLISIVTPRSFFRWLEEERKRGSRPAVKKGRPRTKEDIRRLIVKLAKENQWGYTRILGELRKLRLTSISRNTVKAILRENGLDPGPQRGEGTWDEFITQHAQSLWQCDFFCKRSVTLKGIRYVYVLAFLNVKTRRVILSPATYQPKPAWVIAQAESFVRQAREQKLPVTLVQRDRDSKFPPEFAKVLKHHHIGVKPGAFRSPNTNAFVERFVQSIQQECLDRVIIFGERHMTHLCQEYLAYYHEDRPHQGLENKVPTRQKSHSSKKSAGDTISLTEIRCKQRLGGLLKSYSRRAA